MSCRASSRRTRLAVSLIVGALIIAPTMTARADSTGIPARATLLPARYLTINNTKYLAGNVPSLIQRVVRNPSAQLAFRLISQCRSARLWAFISTRGSGIVGWVPENIWQCVGTAGGGPSSPSWCFQAFHTPAVQDPAGVRGPPAWSPRYYVLIAGTGPATCSDLSTQVPGGVWGRTTATVGGLPVGTNILIKCQRWAPQGLVDYVAPATGLPSSKHAYWMWDANMYTGTNQRLDGVPQCWNQ